jgi:predicted metalloprotease with PDZ domain
MTRLTLVLALFGAMLGTAPALAEEKCPLDVASCLQAFASARERPWLGVELEMDSTGARQVIRVVPGSPAQKAGMRPGDVLRSLDGRTPTDWFAGKAGWSTSGRTACTVLRGKRERELAIERRPMSDEMLARIVGTHMVEQHMAYAELPRSGTH